jgi:2-polyprenyl-6-hydroxyphenyl methylase/3-demethylubiquinone-9 3-methyltransferase
MLDKRAVLASIYRGLKFGGRLFCLAPDADFVWYRTIAPLLGFSTKHLSSDRLLTQDEFSALLDQAGFRRIRFAPWTFIPKGDVPALVAILLTVLDVIGRLARLDSFRGGLSLCAWKEAKPT